jgi:multidrug resistance protein MdtO
MSPRVISGQVLDLLRPAPGRLGFTLRMALVCAIITLVIETYQLPSLATTVYIAFFILKADRGATLVAAIVMPIVLTIALLITLLLTATVLDHPFWRVMTMALFSFTILFLGSASKLKPIAATYAVVIGYTLDLLGGLEVGELATRAILYTWLVIGIPAAACMLVALVTGPAPRRLLGRALAERLHAAAKLLESGSGALVQVETLLRHGDAELQELLKSAQREHGLPAADTAALARAIDATMAILSYALLLGQAPADASTEQPRRQVAAVLEEMAGILDQGGYPIGIVAPTFDPALLPAGAARPLGLLCAELGGFTQASPARPAAKNGGFMLPDAFTNPAHVRYALKTTGAAMFCYLVFQQLDWAGIHTSMITCFVV